MATIPGICWGAGVWASIRWDDEYVGAALYGDGRHARPRFGHNAWAVLDVLRWILVCNESTLTRSELSHTMLCYALQSHHLFSVQSYCILGFRFSSRNLWMASSVAGCVLLRRKAYDSSIMGTASLGVRLKWMRYIYLLQAMLIW